MSHLVDVQCIENHPDFPDTKWYETWIERTLPNEPDMELSIRLVDEEEMQQLNRDFRGKDYPTNVLSFQVDLPKAIQSQLEHYLLGDLVLCVPVILNEAVAQQKEWKNHLAHLVVHGCLHLLGMDHETDAEAKTMEQEEIRILAKGGIGNPYESEPEGNQQSS